STQVSALCLYISDSYSGLLQPGVETAVYGPFTITSANGCAGAAIDVSASTGGGRAPQLLIQKQVGVSWQSVATSFGSSASYSGSFGTYRVAMFNSDPDVKSYSGTAKYGR
ncbi:hypothetical protein, partial [Pseudomonas fluorescens]|uniref:hypothetical protein n=1 Tax=Pseudomonas fluorescens TaxID=294 RepID=UPI001F44116B